MHIVVIDGMGGGIGKAIVEHLKSELPEAEITAVGTNGIATSAMLKAGAHNGATGENAVVYNCAKADYIVGVIGIVLANAMQGEISPKMAEAAASSPAHKILIPTGKCSVSIAGAAENGLQGCIADIPRLIRPAL